MELKDAAYQYYSCFRVDGCHSTCNGEPVRVVVRIDSVDAA